MALDIFATPACSDEPERVFSIAGNTLNPRRRVITADCVQELLCLRSWQKGGIIKLDGTLFTTVVADAAARTDDDDDESTNDIDQLQGSNDDLVGYER